MMAGGALTTGGLIGFGASLPRKDWPEPEQPASPVLDPGAADCIEWRRELDAESDPARRGAINAIRPAHCPRPAAPPEGPVQTSSTAD